MDEISKKRLEKNIIKLKSIEVDDVNGDFVKHNEQNNTLTIKSNFNCQICNNKLSLDHKCEDREVINKVSKRMSVSYNEICNKCANAYGRMMPSK